MSHSYNACSSNYISISHQQCFQSRELNPAAGSEDREQTRSYMDGDRTRVKSNIPHPFCWAGGVNQAFAGPLVSRLVYGLPGLKLRTQASSWRNSNDKSFFENWSQLIRTCLLSMILWFNRSWSLRAPFSERLGVRSIVIGIFSWEQLSNYRLWNQNDLLVIIPFFCFIYSLLIFKTN